ncbi:glyoxalase [Streptomyces sp. NRRL F-4489]|uniref:VOC family protein n=1 Tax=Streptomyces sp. NRRL F-4489 TaxID=1609095 RepID=UPI0007467ACA|nr:VOC family protein [Streptomyces sp. NRRL F-4489]KUL38060.1 glyoxalase [Streptomyces sp. NRRL F-4489]
MLAALDHVQLAAPAGSQDVLRSFYLTALQMVEIPRPPALARRGDCWFAAADGGRLEIHVGIEDGYRPPRKAHPAVRVVGLDALAARLEAFGAPVVWNTSLPGYRRFVTQDPVGNRLEFLEPLG